MSNTNTLAKDGEHNFEDYSDRTVQIVPTGGNRDRWKLSDDENEDLAKDLKPGPLPDFAERVASRVADGPGGSGYAEIYVEAKNAKPIDLDSGTAYVDMTWDHAARVWIASSNSPQISGLVLESDSYAVLFDCVDKAVDDLLTEHHGNAGAGA